MSKLYLMRHGQTEYNMQLRVQGRCDSPLTELGVKQAHAAAAWFTAHDVHFDRMCASPLGRTRGTLDTIRAHLTAAGDTALPPIEFIPGLIERCYGVFESGPREDVPADLWDPGDALVPYGGEGNASVRSRMVDTLTRIMLAPHADSVLAVSHGSATYQFKQAWEHLATCPQDVHLGNCCILVYEFDPATQSFMCEQIVNHSVE